MTSIDRRRFTQDLGGRVQLNRAHQPTQRAMQALSVDSADLARFDRNRDGVLHEDEIGAVFDHFQSLDARAPLGDISRAQRFYDAMTQEATEAPSARRTEAGRVTVDGTEHDAFVEVTPQVQAQAQAVLQLPPAEGNGRGREDAVHFLSAMRAREAGQARPTDVPGRIWNMTDAMQTRGITAADVEHFLGTGRLADQVDSDGQTLRTGQDRMAGLEQAARGRGSWTAVNSLTFLTNLRRSVVTSQAQALDARAATLPEGADRTQLETMATDARAYETELAQGLQQTYRAASAARERRAGASVRRGDTLDQRAAAAEQRGDAATAQSLRQQADASRSRGARLALSEAQYRGQFSHARTGAARAYDLAAQAQISRGGSELAQARRDNNVPAELPSTLGYATEAQNADGVPGAGRLLDESRAIAPDHGDNHRTLALQTTRDRLEADFHRSHLTQAGYFDPSSTTTPSSAVTDRADAWMEALGLARAGYARRLELYGPADGLSASDAEAAADVSRQERTTLGEVNVGIARAAANERQITAARDRSARLRDTQAELPSGMSDHVTHAQEAVTQAVDDNDVMIDTRSDRDGSRDSAAVRQARNLRRTTEAQSDFLGAQRRRVVTDLAASDAEVVRLEGQAPELDRRAGVAAQAMAASGLPGVDGATPTQAYGAVRDRQDALVDLEDSYLTRAATEAPDDQELQFRVAASRIGLIQHTTQSIGLDNFVLGTTRPNVMAQLNQAEQNLGRVDTTRQALEAGSEGRRRLTLASTEAGAGLAEANAPFRPTASRQILARSETVAQAELQGDDLRSARGRIGRAAVTSLVRADDNIEDIFASGHYEAGDADALYGQAQRNLRPSRSDSSEETNRARALLGRVTDNLNAVDSVLSNSRAQFQSGWDMTEAQAGMASRQEIQAERAKVSSLISGPTWAVTGLVDFVASPFTDADLHIDMKEMIGEAGDSSLGHRTGFARQGRDRVMHGAQQLRGGFRQARSEGRAFEMLHGLRILSHDYGELDSTTAANLNSQAHGIYQNLDGFMPRTTQRGLNNDDWSGFTRHYIGGPRSPLASSLSHSVMGLERSNELLGDRNLPQTTAGMEDMVTSASESRDQSMENLGWYVGINLVGEVAVGIVATGGLGSVAAVGEAANVGRTAVTIGRTAQMANNLSRGARALQLAGGTLRAMGQATAVGAGMMGLSYGTREIFGHQSWVTSAVDVGANFIPIGAAQRVSGLTARLEAGAARMGQAEARIAQGTSRAARVGQWARASANTRSIAQHAYFYAPQLALGGGQALAVHFAAPALADAMGWEGQAGQMAAGLALGALFAGGMHAGPQAARALSQHMTQRHRISAPVQRRIEADVQGFMRRTEGRMPTEAEVGQLRSRLAERMGLSGEGAASQAGMQSIDASISALRTRRASELGMRDIGPLTAENAGRAVDNTAAHLAGPDATPAQRAAARRQATEAVSLHSAELPIADQARIQQRLADDLRATEMSAAFREVSPEGGQPVVHNDAHQAQVTAILRESLPALRTQLEAGHSLTAQNGGQPSHFEALGQRLRETGMSREGAEAVLRGVQQDLVQRTALTRVAQQQASRGTLASEADIRATTESLARQAGLPESSAQAFAADMAQSAGFRDLVHALFPPRYRGMTPEQRQADFVQRNPTGGDLGNLTTAEFRAAFGDGPYQSSLADLATHPNFDTFARQHPAQARELYRAARLYGSFVQNRLQHHNGNFQAALADVQPHLRTTRSVNLPSQAGTPSNPQTVSMQVSHSSNRQAADTPALRMAPSDRSFDHNGAFMDHGQTPGRLGRSRTGWSDQPRDYVYIKPQQLEIGPNGQRATQSDLSRTAFFAAHGGPNGFGQLSTADAARAMAREIAGYSQAHGGRPPIEFVVLESCHQGTRRRGAGPNGPRTNAQEFDAVLNQELANLNHPPVQTLAARDGGVLYGGASHGRVLRGRRPAEFVPAQDQRMRMPPEQLRRYLLGGLGAVGLGGATAGLTYAVVERREAQRRRRAPAPRPQVQPQP